MRIVRSKLLGYCHGVSETVRLANQVLKKAESKNLPAYSIGELIHNPEVVASFREKGLKVIEKPSDGMPGVALVRAHGISTELRKQFEDAGFTLVDSTCVNIQKSQKIIKQNVKDGRTIIILGVKGHAETKCLMGTDVPNAKYFMVTSVDDLPKLYQKVEADTPVCIITQTTFPAYTFENLVDFILSHYEDSLIGNKLCHACIQRKNNGIELANMVEAVIVVGGKNSENTQDLANWISRTGKPVYCVETVSEFTEELDEKLKQYQSIGLASGTSTPTDIIEEVASHLETL